MLKRGTYSESGINPRAVYNFVKKCKDSELGLDGFMLIKDGKVISEGYQAPYNKDSHHVLYSFSKSITATALGFAISEGLISLDDSICKFFGEYDKHGLNKKITIKHLVTMTAGKLVPMARNRHQKDWIKIFFDSTAIAKPGKIFMYVNDNFYLLSAIISKVSGKTLVDYLEPRLFTPLGIEKPVWETDKFGYAAGGWGLYMKAEDVAKIMLCYAQNGIYNNEQIIPKAWIDEATKHQVPTVKKGQIDVTKGYGYGFWQTDIPNSYRAYGLHGQVGWVFKDTNTVLIVYAGISRDELQSKAIREMYYELFSEPELEYEDKLNELISHLGDKDNIPPMPRNYELENKYNNVALKTISPSFASMLHATITTVMDAKIGHIDRFILTKDNADELSLIWKEGEFVNTVKLGFDNKYAVSKIKLAGINYTAHTKASWIRETMLSVLIRIEETSHVRRLDFDFSNKNNIVVKNNSYPDMPTLASHYLDFSGFPLPKALDKLLIDYVAPAVLLLGEPDFKIR